MRIDLSKSAFGGALPSICIGIALMISAVDNAYAEEITGGTFDVQSNSTERRALRQKMELNGVQVVAVQSEPSCTKYKCVFDDEFHYEFRFHHGLTCENWTNSAFNAMTGYSRVHVSDADADSIHQYGHAGGRSYDHYIRNADFFFIDPASASDFISRCNGSPGGSGPDGANGALTIAATTDGLGNIRLDATNSSKVLSMELDSYTITKCIGIVECGTNTFAMIVPPGMTKNVTSVTRGNTDANGNQPSMSFTYCWTYRALGKGADPSKVNQGCATASSPGSGPP